MNMNLRSFFEFSNTEAAAVLIVVIIIVITFFLNVSLSKRNNDISLTKNDSLVLSFEKMQNELKESDNKSHIALVTSNKATDIVDGNNNRLTDQPQKKGKQRYVEYIKQEKLSASESISLNKSDTADWKKVPGIGSSYAKRIVKYRALLGGYKSVEQLKEVIASYPNVDDYVWAQEEPKNMGAYSFMLMNFDLVKLRLASLKAYSAPAAGSYARSKKRHAEAVAMVFDKNLYK